MSNKDRQEKKKEKPSDTLHIKMSVQSQKRVEILKHTSNCCIAKAVKLDGEVVLIFIYMKCTELQETNGLICTPHK